MTIFLMRRVKEGISKSLFFVACNSLFHAQNPECMYDVRWKKKPRNGRIEKKQICFFFGI